MKKRHFLLLFSACCILFHTNSYSQNEYTWWNQKHHWDGYTPWRYYLTMSPGYMGPNALPVPEIFIIPDKVIFENRLEAHNGKGDKTQNYYTRISIPVKKVAALHLWMVPVEHFRLDSVTRDKRAARSRDPQGRVTGDLYASAQFRLPFSNPTLPDFLFEFAVKTASGGGLENARYTDAPAYYFDVSALWKLMNNNMQIQPMAGFYCWQIYHRNLLQNDAFLFGTQWNYKYGNWISRANCSGYIGYLNKGDKPIVVNFHQGYSFKKNTIFLGIRRGLHDFPYTTFSFSIQSNILLKTKTP